MLTTLRAGGALPILPRNIDENTIIDDNIIISGNAI